MTHLYFMFCDIVSCMRCSASAIQHLDSKRYGLIFITCCTSVFMYSLIF